jgi:hypothetical protein
LISIEEEKPGEYIWKAWVDIYLNLECRVNFTSVFTKLVIT